MKQNISKNKKILMTYILCAVLGTTVFIYVLGNFTTNTLSENQFAELVQV
jgi:hypothetical protein